MQDTIGSNDRSTVARFAPGARMASRVAGGSFKSVINMRTDAETQGLECGTPEREHFARGCVDRHKGR